MPVAFAANPLTIATTAFTNGTANALYTTTLAATGGTTPYVWSLVGGALAPGLTLNASSGVISGTPTRAGYSSFTVRVVDFKLASATKSFSLLLTNKPANPYANAPGGPILVVTNAANPFSQYYAEVLLTEGLNEFALMDLGAVSSAALSTYDVVILGQATLSSAQVTIFSNWVNGGGSLIAMRPDAQLASLLGVTAAGSSLSEGYLLVNTASGPGAGIVGETIQFHGAADLYTLGAASNLATLYSSATTPTANTNPAVTLRSVGSGRAAAFTYDLARSIVLTRQGNPAWAGQDRDGIAPIRNNDLFYGNATSDPQPDWVNLGKVAIPQADEQQRLLANLIIAMNASKKLLPRFWYFPNNAKAAVVMTSDNHGLGTTAACFDQQLAAVPVGSVDDWQTIRSSVCLFPYPNTYGTAGENLTLTGKSADYYNTVGFDIGVHVDTGCTNWTAGSLDTAFSDQLLRFSQLYSNVPPPVWHRIHCIAWSDYTTLPTLEFKYGIRLDANYYYYPPGWVQNRPGFMTGSGMPMRFAQATGGIIDVYQAATQLTDESSQGYPYTIDTLLDRALGAEGYYGAFVANMHTDVDNAQRQSSVWAAAIVNSAIAQGVPVVSARQMLAWLDARNASSFKSIAWNSGNMRETFSVQASPGARGLQAMLPVPRGYTVGGILFNGSAITYSYQAAKGLEYVTFAAGTGDYAVTFATDTASPTISTWFPTNGATDVSWNTNLTVAFNEAMNGLTITTNTITLRDAVGNIVPARVYYNPTTFTAVLKPSRSLGHLQTNTARVEGGAAGVTDVAGNPMANRFEWTLTTKVGAPYSIWSESALPANPLWNDLQPYELGVKFTSDVSGYVTGVRFYKGGAANSGTHVGHLWSVDGGSPLATATFTGETDSGWQEADFATPVAITSNTIYIASYYAPWGRYAVDRGVPLEPGNLLTGVDHPPLHAVANSQSANGVYLLGGSGFPSQTTANGANYWVDVAFSRGVLAVSGINTYYPSIYPTNGLSTTRVGNATMSLTGDTNLSTVALADGSYRLSNVPVGGNYCITPSKTDDSAPASGVTVADLAMIQAQVLGKLALGPYQLLAADVNTNGSITVADLALIQAVILGKRTNFPAGLWRFVPADYVFPDPAKPWDAPSQRSYTNRVTGLTNGDFIAIKLGDVNASWKPPVGGSSLVLDGPKEGAALAAAVPEVVFGVGDQSAQPGQTVSVPVVVKGFHQVISAQFSLGWDPAVLRYAGTGSYGLKGLSAACFGTTLSASGKLAVAWFDSEAAGVTLADDTVLFNVSFEVIGKADSLSAVSLVSSPTPQEVSMDAGPAAFGAKDGSVDVIGPGVEVSYPVFAKGVFQLSVPTEKGRWYTLEFTHSLSPANWTALPAVAGDGTVTVLLDRAGTNQQRYYRVHVQ
jgi:hypothetical protein